MVMQFFLMEVSETMNKEKDSLQNTVLEEMDVCLHDNEIRLRACIKNQNGQIS